MDDLTHKQRRFVQYYLQCFNGTRAAIKAGYSKKGAHVEASRLLRNAKVKRYIDAGFNDSHMSPAEILGRLTAQARGDIGDILDEWGRVDIEKAHNLGMTHLIHSVEEETIINSQEDTETHSRKLKMYDAQKAMFYLMRAHAMFNDTVTVRTWIDDALDAIKAKQLDYETAHELFGPEQAASLFDRAGEPYQITAGDTVINVEAVEATDAAHETDTDTTE